MAVRPTATYEDVVRYLERLAGEACKPVVLTEVYAEDHPASASAQEAVAAAREVRDFLRHLFERMYELRRSRAHQAYDAVWQAAEAAAAAAEQEGRSDG
jgi:hypothetical protein